MSDSLPPDSAAPAPVGHSRHVDLSLDQLVELQPGLGRLMPEVGRRNWILYYAAQGGNWELAHYQWRQLTNLFKMGAVLRPKQAKNLQAFQNGSMRPIEAAILARDWTAFDQAFREGIDSANRFHALTGYTEIRWRLPQSPPEEFDLGPGGEQS